MKRALIILLLLASSVVLRANDTLSVKTEDVVRNARKAFGVDDRARLTAQPLKTSSIPGVYETRFTLESDEGKSTFHAYVTTDQSFLLVGKLQAFVPGTKDEVKQAIAKHLHVNAAEIVAIQEKDSVFPDLMKVQLTVVAPGGTRTRTLFKIKKTNLLVLGWVYPLLEDAAPHDVRKAINTDHQLAEGSRNASVVLVEYADLACPSCAVMSKMLQDDVIPKYGKDLRIVYKEFPLISLHPWAFQGAVAAQCALTIAPQKAVEFRNLVLEHQSELTEQNAREKLLKFAKALTISVPRLGSCLDSKKTAARVLGSLDEGESLAVSGTPTLFVNGERLVGDITSDKIQGAIDRALRDRKRGQDPSLWGKAGDPWVH